MFSLIAHILVKRHQWFRSPPYLYDTEYYYRIKKETEFRDPFIWTTFDAPSTVQENSYPQLGIRHDIEWRSPNFAFKYGYTGS